MKTWNPVVMLCHCLDIIGTRQIWRVFYERQKLIILREHLSSLPIFGGLRVAHLFSFVCVWCFFFFVFFFSRILSVSCAHCCQCLWIVQLLLRFSLPFICWYTCVCNCMFTGYIHCLGSISFYIMSKGQIIFWNIRFSEKSWKLPKG
jgi:hypothetical protein